ncbi:hypothetical protein [Clostridium perfringens]|uniref:hypothetical protein n=1 Tax=Clostridium perfringens TaxID=1502 RepID=UPI002AC37FE9|nr:hypothetical protein [Clostridium perfringens]MDZ5130326.1 hypothetical protein [Clostridium perfringens]
MKNKKLILVILCLVLGLGIAGCSAKDISSKFVGSNNNDFEYIKENKVDKIVIQSTRDSGFRFLVKEKSVIDNIYSMLSKAEVVSKKTDLPPDYIFEIHVGDEEKKFYYVTGVKNNGEGNFYDGDHFYRISKRLDNYLMQNMQAIRKPRAFDEIYYNSILEVMKKEKDELNKDNDKVGIDILGDRDCTKYMLSSDIEDFEKDVKKVVPNASIMNHNRDDFDIIVTVRNYGYTSTMFRTVITIENRLTHSEKKFYVDGVYKNSWDINVYDSWKDVQKEWDR